MLKGIQPITLIIVDDSSPDGTVAIAEPVALIGILVLVVLLVPKELSSAAAGTCFEALRMHLDLGILPGIIAFVEVVISRVVQVLR